MPTKQERIALLVKVLHTDEAMNKRDLKILRIYCHTAATVKTLRKDLGDILEKFHATEDICWEFLDESPKWQDNFSEYRRKFRASLSLGPEDYWVANHQIG